MNPRTKKLLLVLVSPFFLLAYTIVALAGWDLVPDHWFLQLLYVMFAGLIWAFPLKPVLQWATRPEDGAHGDMGDPNG